MKRKLSVNDQLSGISILACLVILVWLSNCRLSYAKSGSNSRAASGVSSGAANGASSGTAIRATGGDDGGDDGGRASGKITILLKERAEAGGEMILLGEIALFQGADEALAGELSQITLGKSPQPGYTVTITSQSILYQLKNHNNHRNAIDPANISFSGPDRCLVARQYREVTAEEVETIFRERFFEQFSETEFELEKVKVGLPRNARVPDGKDGNIEYEVTFQDPPTRQEENFIFKIKHDGEVVKQIWISARLRYHTMVSVATRNLGKGETITAEDVAQKSVVLNRSRISDPERIDDPAQIIGMVCLQPIRAGSTLTLKMVDRPLLVKRGAIIKMTVESKNLRIVSLGKAKSDGRQGEIISAENLTSATGAPSQGQGQMSNVYGVVIGENQIRITF